MSGTPFEHRVAPTQHPGQEAVLLPGREHRRGRQAAEPVAVHLVPRQRVDRQPQVADVERLLEHAGHAVELGRRRLGRVRQRALQPHDVGAHRGVPQERADVGAERQTIQVVQVALGRVPVLDPLQQRQHLGAGHALDATEHVGEVLGAADGEGQTARADQHRGDAVSHRLAERRVELELGVVVGVQVDEARCDPAARRVDDLGTVGHVQIGLDGAHDAVVDQHVRTAPLGTRAVDDEPAPDECRHVGILRRWTVRSLPVGSSVTPILPRPRQHLPGRVVRPRPAGVT